MHSLRVFSQREAVDRLPMLSFPIWRLQLVELLMVTHLPGTLLPAERNLHLVLICQLEREAVARFIGPWNSLRFLRDQILDSMG